MSPSHPLGRRETDIAPSERRRNSSARGDTRRAKSERSQTVCFLCQLYGDRRHTRSVERSQTVCYLCQLYGDRRHTRSDIHMSPIQPLGRREAGIAPSKRRRASRPLVATSAEPNQSEVRLSAFFASYMGIAGTRGVTYICHRSNRWGGGRQASHRPKGGASRPLVATSAEPNQGEVRLSAFFGGDLLSSLA